MMKRMLMILVLSLVGFISVFACDTKVGGIWYEDVPCCVAKLSKEYKRCDKLSLEEFDKANKLRDDMTKLIVQLGECKEAEKRACRIKSR